MNKEKTIAQLEWEAVNTLSKKVCPICKGSGGSTEPDESFCRGCDGKKRPYWGLLKPCLHEWPNCPEYDYPDSKECSGWLQVSNAEAFYWLVNNVEKSIILEIPKLKYRNRCFSNAFYGSDNGFRGESPLLALIKAIEE